MTPPRRPSTIVGVAGALDHSTLASLLSEPVPGPKLVAGPEDMRPVTRSYLEDEPTMVSPYVPRASRSKDWESRNKPRPRRRKK